MFLEVHLASVRGIAARDYPADVVDAWAPTPVTDDAVERALLNPDGEIRLAAVIGGAIVGIGALVLASSELRACYVAPGAARSGVGAAIVAEIEHIAREHGLTFLQLHSSITAEQFYLRRGYRPLGRGEFILRSGHAMACIRMRKDFG